MAFIRFVTKGGSIFIVPFIHSFIFSLKYAEKTLVNFASFSNYDFFSFLMTHYLSNKVQFISNDNLPASNPDNRKSLILSNDIGFPSPVIQLQQTIVHGLIESESIALPLLRGGFGRLFTRKH